MPLYVFIEWNGLYGKSMDFITNVLVDIYYVHNRFDAIN